VEEHGGPDPDLNILTEVEMLVEGLKLLGWTEEKLNRPKEKRTNVDRFRGHYGADPHVVAQIWEDLQTTSVEAARIDVKSRRKIKYFFMTLHFLKRYGTEVERETTWQISENTLRLHCWYFVDKIRALMAEKIGWPADNFKDDVWVMSVDGTHFLTEEVTKADPSSLN